MWQCINWVLLDFDWSVGIQVRSLCHQFINSFVVLQVKFDSIRADDQKKNFPTALTVRITSQSFCFIYWNYCFFVGIFWQKKSGILISSSPPRSEITMIKHWKKLFHSFLLNVKFKFINSMYDNIQRQSTLQNDCLGISL